MPMFRTLMAYSNVLFMIHYNFLIETNGMGMGMEQEFLPKKSITFLFRHYNYDFRVLAHFTRQKLTRQQFKRIVGCIHSSEFILISGKQLKSLNKNH